MAKVLSFVDDTNNFENALNDWAATIVPGPGQIVVGGPTGPVKVIAAVNVLAYGATGDGSTDDTLAIRAAIAAAGTNGTVIFPAGKSFLISGSLTPLAGQTWIGYGATVKRRNAISTTTNTPIASNTTKTITVADASQFRVGMDINVFSGSTFDTANRRISAISGNQITVAAAFQVNLPSGGTVLTSFATIDTELGNAANNVPDVTIRGFTIDGNSANNALLNKWQTHSEICLAGDRNRVRDCVIRNAQAEGMLLGGFGVDVSNNTITDCQGNGIHFGALTPAGTNQIRVHDNFVKNCNLGGVAVGHADGCIVFSNLCQDSFITGNYCENGIAGVASINSNDNSSVVIAHNIVRNCTSYAIGGLTSNDYVQQATVTGNLIVNSGNIYWYGGGTPSVGQAPRRMTISGNYLEMGMIQLVKCLDLTVTGNTVWNNTSTTIDGVSATDCSGLTVVGNDLNGCNRAVIVGNTASVDVLVSGNRMLNPYKQGIEVWGSATVLATGNVITMETTFTPAAGASGIRVIAGSTVQNNRVTIGPNLTGLAGIFVNGGTDGSVQGSIVDGNTIRSGSNVPSITINGQQSLVVNNFVQQAVSNPGGVSNSVTNNTTIL